MKRLSMALATTLMAVLGLFALAGVATADETYPPVVPPPTLSIIGDCSDTIDGVMVEVTGLQPGSKVTIKWKNPSGSVRTTAGADGIATATLPIKKAGKYTVTASGTAADGTKWSDSVPVTVKEACDGNAIGGEGDGSNGSGGSTGGTTDGTNTGGLADTGGGNSSTLLAWGVAALVLGGTTLLVARNRRWGNTDES